MKFTLCLVSAVLVLATSFGGLVPAPKGHHQHKFITKESITPNYQQQTVGLDKCSTCINFAQQALQILIDEIANVGILGSCQELCQLVEQKTGSQALGAVCNILCDVVGIKEFVDIIEKVDLDPIYYCEELKACPVKDDGDAKFTKFEVMPKSGPQGDFDISFEYVSQNGTGTGEIFLDIDAVDHLPIDQGFLHELAPAGTYTGSFKLRAEPDPDCDPTQGPCEEWLPGVYPVNITICNGECGSKHPHSKIYDRAMTSFTITDQ